MFVQVGYKYLYIMAVASFLENKYLSAKLIWCQNKDL